ncbi:MAG: alpha-galactosidase [Pseudomonadota bacterium]
MNNLITVSDDLQFCLANKRISYLFRVSPEGLLEHLHFGGRVSADALAAEPRRPFRSTTLEYQGVKNLSLSDTPQEYPLFGTSDMRHPAMHLVNAQGNSTNTLTYHGHRVVEDKPALDGLPSARGGNCATLLVELVDTISEIRVELRYTVYSDFDVIARSALIRNEGSADIELNAFLSSSLDLPAGNYEMMHFTGTWAREFNAQRMPLPAGRFVVDSASGVSSNAHSPFVILMEQGSNETSGDVYAAALVYSGNFAITVEQGEFEAVRLSAGINPFNFKWKLAPGESFTSPESLQVFSPNGLDGMSQTWHQFIKQQVSPQQFSRQPRPTYLNSWEATYFDLNEQVVLDLADKAKGMGLEMLVVDDGWFAGRNDDTTSLGDWTSDATKFPNGIESVAARVREKGLKFGLWFEPEMVNEQSQLYQDHPDWIIHIPGRTCSTGRQQLVLDLSRREVIEYLFEHIDRILGCGDINYVKWDINRVMTEIGSAGLPSDRQLETPHRYMLGVYELVGRLVERHPHILFENCASGGNRFDLGMLSFMSQGWVSDMSEPIGRLPIITGASYLYPPSVLASYIGPVPSHQNDRMASVKTRGEVGFFCAARGLSLNVEDIDQDCSELQHFIELYKDSAEDVVNGRFHRLRVTDNEVCWQLNSEDGSTLYLGYFHILSATNLPLRRVRLRDLDASANYVRSGVEEVYGGDSLMHMGIDLPYVHAMQNSASVEYMARGDFSSWLIKLQKV